MKEKRETSSALTREFLELAVTVHMSRLEAAESASNCSKKRIGCVIFSSGGALASGHNGALHGDSECSRHFKFGPSGSCSPRKGKGVWNSHYDFSKVHEIHAEADAIASLAASGYAIPEGVELAALVSYSPCHQCFLLLARIGVRHILFKHVYRRECDNFGLARKMGVSLYTVERNFRGEWLVYRAN